MAERVEEYRYISHSAGELRDLSIPLLTLRISKFQKVHARLTAVPGKGAPSATPQLTRRLSR